jgi:hypothetical protein
VCALCLTARSRGGNVEVQRVAYPAVRACFHEDRELPLRKRRMYTNLSGPDIPILTKTDWLSALMEWLPRTRSGDGMTSEAAQEQVSR